MRKINEILAVVILSLMAVLFAAVGMRLYDTYVINRQAEAEMMLQEEVLSRNSEAHERVQQMRQEIEELSGDREKLGQFLEEIRMDSEEAVPVSAMMDLDTDGMSGNVEMPEKEDISVLENESGISGDTTIVSGDMTDSSDDMIDVSDNTTSMSDNYMVSGNASSVSGNGTVSGDAPGVSGSETVSGNGTVSGNASDVSGSETVSGNMPSVSGNMPSVSGNGTVSGNASGVSGNSTVSGNASGVSGNSTVSGNASSLSGNETVSGNALSVSGNETVSGNVFSVSGNASGISGNGTVFGNGAVSGNMLELLPGIEIVSPEITLVQRRQIRSSLEETLRVNWEDQACLEERGVDFSGKKIACLGDSITAAANLEEEEGYLSYAYPSVLKELLGAEEVYNLGVGGSSIGRYWSDAFVERYTQIPQDTDIIIVMGGTNDGFCLSEKEFGSLSERKPWTFCGDLDELMRGLKENYPNADIFFTTPLPNILQDYLMRERKYLLPQTNLADVILTLSASYGFQTIDLYNSNILDSHDADIVADYMPDGVHGNREGYRILAEHIAAELVRHYEENER